jgi:hypothetical protein
LQPDEVVLVDAPDASLEKRAHVIGRQQRIVDVLRNEIVENNCPVSEQQLERLTGRIISDVTNQARFNGPQLHHCNSVLVCPAVTVRRGRAFG